MGRFKINMFERNYPVEKKCSSYKKRKNKWYEILRDPDVCLKCDECQHGHTTDGVMAFYCTGKVRV